MMARLSIISQSQKDISHVFSHMQNLEFLVSHMKVEDELFKEIKGTRRIEGRLKVGAEEIMGAGISKVHHVYTKVP